MEINEVFSATATLDDCLLIDMDYTGAEGRTREVFAYRASDPYSPLTPLITQWLLDHPDQEILPYVEPAAPTKDELRAHAALKRWEKEVGGLDLNGMRISTDDRSKIMISGARASADSDPTFETVWKVSDNEFVTLKAADIIGISNAVLDHVSELFALEQSVIGFINSDKIKDYERIDEIFK